MVLRLTETVKKVNREKWGQKTAMMSGVTDLYERVVNLSNRVKSARDRKEYSIDKELGDEYLSYQAKAKILLPNDQYIRNLPEAVPQEVVVAERFSGRPDAGLQWVSNSVERLKECLSVHVASTSTLMPEQEEILFKLVEADRRARQTGTARTIFPVRTFGGDSFLIGGEEIEGDYDDFLELGNKGYINLTMNSRGEYGGAVTTEGLTYYKNKRSELPPLEQLVRARFAYLSGETSKRHATVAQLLKEAGNLLWDAEHEFDFSAIGHKCREALQEFSISLYQDLCPDGESLPKDKTLNKMCAVTSKLKPKLGDTDYGLASALFGMWKAVNLLAQKVEHRSQKEGLPLVFEDAERLVLYSHLVVTEIDLLVEKTKP
ncbi:MAG: hypothetical protein HYU86_08545 [Chloroflexi bacterium]|nr:hypothetical protein [Chloroflexota bacterium]